MMQDSIASARDRFFPYVRSTIGRLAGGGVRFRVRTMRTNACTIRSADTCVFRDP